MKSVMWPSSNNVQLKNFMLLDFRKGLVSHEKQKIQRNESFKGKIEQANTFNCF